MGFFSKIVGKGKKEKGGSDASSGGLTTDGGSSSTAGQSFSSFTPSAVVPERQPLGFIAPNVNEGSQAGYGKGVENSPYQMGRPSMKSPVQRVASGQGHPSVSNSSLPKFAPGGELTASSSSSIDTADSSAECSTPATTPSASSPSIVDKPSQSLRNGQPGTGTVTPPQVREPPPSRRFNPSPLHSQVDPSMLPHYNSSFSETGTNPLLDMNPVLRKSRSSSHLPLSASQTSLHNMHNVPQAVYRPRSSMAQRSYSRQNGYFHDLATLAPMREQTAARDGLLAADPAGTNWNLYGPASSTPTDMPKRASLTPTESYKNHLYRRRVVHPVIAEEMAGVPIPRPDYNQQQHPGQRPPLRTDARRRSFHSVSSSPAPSSFRGFSQQSGMPMPHPQQYNQQGYPQRPEQHQRRRTNNHSAPAGYHHGPPPHHQQYPQQQYHASDPRANVRTPQPRRGNTPGRNGKPVEDMLLGLNMLDILERQEKEEEIRKEIESRESAKRWEEGRGRFPPAEGQHSRQSSYNGGHGYASSTHGRQASREVESTKLEAADSGVMVDSVAA